MSISYTRLLQFFQQFGKFYAYQFTLLLEQTGLTMREIHVLLFLANNPDYDTARDVTLYRGMSKSQVSQAVELLCTEGLLQRTPDESDRRMVHLSITREGRPLAQECQALQERCGARLLDGLTPEQVRQLQELLDTVLDNGAHLAEEASK